MATATARAFGVEVSGNAPAASPARGGVAKPRAAAWSVAKLEAAFEKIVEQNNNKLGEWGIRAKGLEALQQLVADGCCESPHFMELFVPMLQEPVLDMTTRSASSKPALVKVGCATVCCLAEALESKLAKHGELYVRALMNNIRDGQTHGVIEDSQECMATLLSNVHGSKMILPLANACDAKAEKSPVCRTAAIEHLSFIVQHWPAAAVKKQLTAIVECIRRMQSDSSPGARTAARQCFWYLHARWEPAANKLLATLDPTAVRQLNSVRKTMGDIEEMEEQSCSQETGRQRPQPSPRKAEPATSGTTRAGEGHRRRTAGLGTAQRMAKGRTAADTSAVKLSKTADAEHPKATSAVEDTGSAGQPSESAETLFLNAMRNCADGSASVRVESFHTLREVCSSLEANTLHRLFDKFVSLLSEHTADGNEKVAAACLEALTAYVESHRGLFSEQHLSALLPAVLLKTVAKDRATNVAVGAALDKMQAHCIPEALLSSVLKTFVHKNSNIQGACLDLTIRLVTGDQHEACATVVGSAKQMKLLLERIVPYIKHRKPEFRRAAAQCLHGLYNAAPEAFTARMRKQTAEEQRSVTGVLTPLVPGFSIGSTVDTSSLQKTTRKAPLPARGSPEAAATVIQSIARGRRGRKLSKEIQRQSEEAEPCQCNDTAAASTARDQPQQPAEETRRHKQKPAVPRQKPTSEARKPKAEPINTDKQITGPSSAVKPQQQEQVSEEVASQHPLFAHKPPPDTARLEQLEEASSLRRTGSPTAPVQDEQVVKTEDPTLAAPEVEAANAHHLAMLKCADVIDQRSDDEDTTELLQSLRHLCDLVTRSAADELQQALPDIFGPLRDCMDHTGVEVRKVVVLCCVNMYLMLGTKMNDELAQLTDVQRRLVQLYVNRIYTKRKEAEEGAART